MNTLNANINNGWVNFTTDDGEECSFHKDSVSMVKILKGHSDTRLIIETQGSSKVQIHYLKDEAQAQYIKELITQ